MEDEVAALVCRAPLKQLGEARLTQSRRVGY